jgi:hypothetical protein
MVFKLPKYKTRCCQSYIDAEQCKRCPFRQIENEQDQQAALNQCACDAHIGGTYQYKSLRIPYYKAD